MEADRNRGGVAKADFVFTIDTSGSMGGDKIRFALKAAKRFVGALSALLKMRYVSRIIASWRVSCALFAVAIGVEPR